MIICSSSSSSNNNNNNVDVTQALRKHAYSNILKILPPKNENFQIKNSDIFHISVRRGGSNEYTQSINLIYLPRLS